MDNLQLSQGGSFALASAVLANGTTAGTLKLTTNPTPYTIDGRFYSKATADNVPFTVTNGSFTGSTKTAKNSAGTDVSGSSVLYGVYLDTAGAVSYVMGSVVARADMVSGASLNWPAPQKGKCCIGAVRIDLTSGTTFIPGTTALNAAGVTTTYYNLMSVPGEPLTS